MSHCNEGLVILFKIQEVPKYLLSDITKENSELFLMKIDSLAYEFSIIYSFIHSSTQARSLITLPRVLCELLAWGKSYNSDKPGSPLQEHRVWCRREEQRHWKWVTGSENIGWRHLTPIILLLVSLSKDDAVLLLYLHLNSFLPTPTLSLPNS